MNLTDEQDAELVQHCAAIKSIVWPHAKELALLLNMLPQAAMTRLLKPYLKGEDARVKNWSVKIYMWLTPEEESLDDSELLWEADPKTVLGMAGIAELIRDTVRPQHRTLPSELAGVARMSKLYPFTPKNLMHHLERMRPAFSRGGGSASTRWFYTDAGRNYMLQADISRVDEETT